MHPRVANIIARGCLPRALGMGMQIQHWNLYRRTCFCAFRALSALNNLLGHKAVEVHAYASNKLPLHTQTLAWIHKTASHNFTEHPPPHPLSHDSFLYPLWVSYHGLFLTVHPTCANFTSPSLSHADPIPQAGWHYLFGDGELLLAAGDSMHWCWLELISLEMFSSLSAPIKCLDSFKSA